VAVERDGLDRHFEQANADVAGTAVARIGCSGWQYTSWRGAFYPPNLAATDWLEYYATRFDTVEVNSTFYRLPGGRVFEEWARRVPPGFAIAVKANRYITHLTRLRASGQPLRRLFTRALGLGDRLGPILYQLPGNLRFDLPRLEAFLLAIDSAIRRVRRRRRHQQAQIRHVIEFRHPSWYRPDVFDLLASHGCACCVHDRAGSVTPRQVVGPFAYLRLHGARGQYHGAYDDDTLAGWAEWLVEQLAAGVDVYAYFNNDPGASAVRNALTLRRMVDHRWPGADGITSWHS